MKRICPGWPKGNPIHFPKWMGQVPPYEDKQSITTAMCDECREAYKKECDEVINGDKDNG